jgi:hypothetical protein
MADDATHAVEEIVFFEAGEAVDATHRACKGASGMPESKHGMRFRIP